MNPKKPRETLPERIVCCISCKQKLWTLRVLKWKGNQPWSTEWVSWNPDLYNGEPKSWDCPLPGCESTFAKQEKTGAWTLSFIDAQTGKRETAH